MTKRPLEPLDTRGTFQVLLRSEMERRTFEHLKALADACDEHCVDQRCPNYMLHGDRSKPELRGLGPFVERG